MSLVGAGVFSRVSGQVLLQPPIFIDDRPCRPSRPILAASPEKRSLSRERRSGSDCHWLAAASQSVKGAEGLDPRHPEPAAGRRVTAGGLRDPRYY